MNRDGEPRKPALHKLPDVLERIAKVMEHGEKKHGAFGWRKLEDLETTEWTDAAQRHILAYQRGELVDRESKLPHLAHAIADLMIALERDATRARKLKLAVDLAQVAKAFKIIKSLTFDPSGTSNHVK